MPGDIEQYSITENYINLSFLKFNMVCTTIKLNMELRNKLEKMKIHPRQSVSEVIETLLNFYIQSKTKEGGFYQSG